MCFKLKVYVGIVASLWFIYEETDLPSDWFAMAVLGCRSLVLVTTKYYER